MNILGKHREQAAHQEIGNAGGVLLTLFEAFGEFGEMPRNLSGDAGRFLRWIEAERVGPDRGEPGADIFVPQIVKRDAEAGSIGELGVLLPRPTEIGIDVDAVADIGDKQERRPAVVDRQRLSIAFGLPARFDHRL